MPAPYTGVGAHVVQSLSPTIQEYADLDDLNAASLVPPIRTILDHVALIWKGQFVGQAANLPGIMATGGANSPGVIALSGSGNQRGALSLGVQITDPTVPVDGDIWVDAQTIKASLGGAVRTMAALSRLNSFTVIQTFNSGLSSNNARIQSVGAPTTGSDAATKTYVDNGDTAARAYADTLVTPKSYGSFRKGPGSTGSKNLGSVSQNVYTDLTAAFGIGVSSDSGVGVTVDSTNGTITIADTGDYFVSASASMSIQTGSANRIGFQITGTGLAVVSDVPALDKLVSMSGSCVTTLAAGTVVKMQVVSDTATGGSNVALNFASLSIRRVG